MVFDIIDPDDLRPALAADPQRNGGLQSLNKLATIQIYIDPHGLAQCQILFHFLLVALLQAICVDLVGFLDVVDAHIVDGEGVYQLVDLLVQRVHFLLNQPDLLVPHVVHDGGLQSQNPLLDELDEILAEIVDFLGALLADGIDCAGHVLGVVFLLEHVAHDLLQLEVHVGAHLLEGVNVGEGVVLPVHRDVLADAL